MHGYRGIMLDLETLGTSPGAGITEIGFCLFNYAVIQDRQLVIDSGYHTTISIADNLRHKMRIDNPTLDWWEYEQGFLPQYTRKSLQAALAEVADKFNGLWKQNIRDVWSKPALFDIPILAEAMDILGIERPLQLKDTNFRHWRCFATLKDVAKVVEPEFNAHVDFRKSPSHNALNDAVDQAVQANIILNVIQAWKEDHKAVVGLRSKLQELTIEKEEKLKRRRNARRRRK